MPVIMAATLVASSILIEDEDKTLQNRFDFIPDKFKHLRFDTVDILYVCPFGVLEGEGHIFGFEGGTTDNPTGLLTKQFEWIVRTARIQNPNIKIIAEQFWGDGGSYTKLNTFDKVKRYSDSVRDFLQLWQHRIYHDPDTKKTVSLRVDGYDVDYDWTKKDRRNSGNQWPWAPQVLSQIRSKGDALSLSPKFYVTITPATTACLKDSGEDLANLDYVNMQNYDGGQDTSADDYLQDIPGLKPSQLLWGLTAEVVSKNIWSVKSVDDAIRNAKANYTGNTETGPLAALHVWRLNSDNWVFENMTLLALYNKVKSIPSPDGLDESVNRGWEDNDKSRAPPFIKETWISMDGYRAPVNK